MSPLESRLRAALSEATDPEQRGVLLAELASYWARTGDFENAEAARIELRVEFGDGHSLKVSVRIIILEALQHYYKDLSVRARERLAPACALSRASSDPTLIALSAAWMAHFELNQARHERAINEIGIAISALKSAALDQFDTTACRIALTLGDANLIFGQVNGFQRWYEVARLEAIRLGDHAALGAITYNRAALRVARARIDSVIDGRVAADLNLLRAEVESAWNYQRVARLQSLDHLLATAKASILILQEQYVEAIEPIESLLALDGIPSDSVQRTLLLADLALAQSQHGQLDLANESAEKCVETYGRLKSVPTDDKCLIASSLARAANAMGKSEMQQLWDHELSKSIEEQKRSCAFFAEKLSQFSPVDLPGSSGALS